jgi:hypothetical protein
VQNHKIFESAAYANKRHEVVTPTRNRKGDLAAAHQEKRANEAKDRELDSGLSLNSAGEHMAQAAYLFIYLFIRRKWWLNSKPIWTIVGV